jgi:hypothetical protein
MNMNMNIAKKLEEGMSLHSRLSREMKEWYARDDASHNVASLEFAALVDDTPRTHHRLATF